MIKRRTLTAIVKSQIEISEDDEQPFVNFTSTTEREYNMLYRQWIKRNNSNDRKTTQELFDDWKASLQA